MSHKYTQLDFDPADFNQWMHRVADLISEFQETLDDRKAFQNRSPVEMARMFEASLPENGQPMEQIFEEIQTKVMDEATLNIGPHFYSYVLSPSNQAGMLAEFIATYLNENTTKWHLNSAGAEIEKRIIEWIADFIHYPGKRGGILLSGGSTANLVCLNVARNQMAGFDMNFEGLSQKRPMIIYVSDQVHYCVDKSCAMLGIGSKHVRKVPTTDAFHMDTEYLTRQIEKDLLEGLQPFCVVGTAGTVNTGAIDPLEEIAEICSKYGLWFHVDAAYGGPAAAVEEYREDFKGLDKADSIAIDPHKWLYVPIEAGCALFKNPKHLKETFSFVPEYLVGDRVSERTDFMEYGPQLTRSFKSLKTWVTFKFYGAQKLREAIHDDIRKASYVGEVMNQKKDFEVLSEPSLSITCFRYKPSGVSMSEEELNALNSNLIDELEKEGKVFITGTTIKGRKALRICIVNHRTQKEHLDFMIRTVEETAKKLNLHEA